MSQEIIIILAVLVVGFSAVFWLLYKQGEKSEEGGLLLIQKEVQEIGRTVNSAIQQQFGQSARIIADVTERLTKLDETNKQVVSFADQLRSLQDILKNPKQR